MSKHESEQVADARVQALNDTARARREEATAARHQAQGYARTAEACRERVTALRHMEKADEALARCSGVPEWAQDSARRDGQRASQLAVILEGEARRHDKEAARAIAEAKRAESEADTAQTKAQLKHLRHPSEGEPSGHPVS
jgi:hypothetical protein